MLTFTDASTSKLAHPGDCGFIGITPAGHLYIEEFYGDGWLAQHHLDAHGQIIESADEAVVQPFEPHHAFADGTARALKSAAAGRDA